MKICYIVLPCLVLAHMVFAQVPVQVIELTNTWRYEATGTDLGTSWREPNYDDSSWLQGRALLAFEDNPSVSPINTVLPILGTTGSVLTTHYFRTSFVYTNSLSAPMLVISNLIDDGGVFYLNGVERARLRMPNGIITNRTGASSSASEGNYNVTAVNATNLLQGTNWFAVEVHQRTGGGGDVVFGMTLHVDDGSPRVTVTPDSPIVPAGAPFLITGVSAGLAPFTYQWLHNEVPLNNATNRRLIIYRSSLANTGDYRLIVRNDFGAITSSVVTITLTNAPSGPGAQNTAYQGEAIGATGSAGFVRAAVALTNGFLVGGGFEGFNGTNSTGIARLDALGNLDPTFIGSLTVGGFFNPPGPELHAVCLDGNHIYIGGIFNGPARTNMARLNFNGSLDASFAPSLPPNGRVRVFVPQTNGGVIVGGEFTSINGVTRGRLARLNANGSLDTNYSQGAGANGMVRTALPLPNGKLLIGGLFSSFDGVPQNGLARLNNDGSLDTTFLLQSNAAMGGVYFLAYSGEQILVGGDFTALGEASAVRLGRISADGLVDPNLNIGNGFVGGAVYTVTEEYNGKLVVGGNFTNFNNAPANYLVRLHPNGVRDETFHTGAGPAEAVLVSTLAPNGEIFVGGLFDYYDGVLAFITALVYGDGPPRLKIHGASNEVVVSWPALASNFVLQSSSSIAGAWTNSPTTPVRSGNRLTYTNAIPGAATYFRLTMP
jgi:uncharacterized delta-60 repeat protein